MPPPIASQSDRYARHLALREIGKDGQARLLASRVLIVGVGGLGSPAALYLAAAGVGTIGIIDADTVELSNLQRQVLHSTSDLGRLKVDSAARKLRDLNPDVTVRTHPERLSSANALRILPDYEFVIDATDNFASKFLIADACHFARKAYAHAGILEFRGQTFTVIPGQTACYRCVFGAAPDAPPAMPAGPMGPVPGVIGSIQAMEAIKFILNLGSLLVNRLLIWDALTMDFRVTAVRRNPHCPLCGDNPQVRELKP